MKPAASLIALTVLTAACQPPAVAPESAAAPAPATASAPAVSQAPADAGLTAFVEARTREAMAPLGYVARSSGEGADALTLVYLVGPAYCGSGGCNLLILRRDGDSYTVLGETTVARTPIRILRTRTNGLPDLGVVVCGGGIMECYEAVLPFDGRRYASNPTMPPAYRPTTPPDGDVVISEELVRLTLAGQS